MGIIHGPDHKHPLVKKGHVMATHHSIKVHIQRYADRKNLLLYYFDPVSGKRRTRSAGTHVQSKAERAAALWERELNEGGTADSRISWSDFRHRYEHEHLAELSDGACRTGCLVLDTVEDIICPQHLRSFNSSHVPRLVTHWRKRKLATETIRSYLGHLRIALNWARQNSLLVEEIHVPMPKRKKGSLMRGRPITTEEHERMKAAARHVCPRIYATWEHFLDGLWLSGLRLSEALRLSWDASEPFSVDMSGEYPRLRIFAEAQKSRRSELVPVAPDFGQWLLEQPIQRGRVFNVNRGIAKTGKTFKAIAERARVVTDPQKKKYATPHDYRRAFGTRWAKRVMPAVLGRLMRHQDARTTSKYYIGLDADDVAADLWKQFGAVATDIATDGVSN